MKSYCFGPFELDLRDRVLYRDAELVPLTPKAFDLLAVLVENAGRVVARDEISQIVWHDVFIDESNITKNISTLRKTLRTHLDDNPIRTIPKRGYQFVLEVAVSEAVRSVEPRLLANPSSTGLMGISDSPQPDHRAGDLPLEGSQRGARTRRSTRLVLGSCLGLVCLGLTIFAARWFFGSRAELETGRRSVAILPFNNLSGSGEVEWVGSALRETLISDLDAGGSLRVIPDDAVDRMQRDLKLVPSANLSRALVQRIGANVHCDYVVGGAYLQVGDTVRLDTFLQNTHNGKVVERFSQTRSSRELLGLLAVTGTHLQVALGARNSSSAAPAVVASSLAGQTDALRLYVEGLRRLRMFDGPGALQFLDQSLAADPSFPLAHSALAETYTLMGDDAQAAAEAKSALNTSSALNGEQRLAIQASYERSLRQWDAAIRTETTLTTTFPDNPEYALELGQVLLLAGKPADALGTVQQQEHDPNGNDPRVFLAEAGILYQLGDYQRVKQAALRAQQLAQTQEAHILFGRARTLEGDALVHIGDAAQARAAFTEAGSVAEAYGDKVGLMHALRREGGAVGLNDPRASLPLFEKDCATAKEVGDAREFINCRVATAFVYQRLGDIGRALPIFEETLQASETVHDRRLGLVSLEALGGIQARMAQWKEARQSQERASALAETMNSSTMKASLLGDGCVLLTLQGQLDAAHTRCGEALQVARTSGDPIGVAVALGHLAQVLDRSGDAAAAGKALQEECAIWVNRGQQLGSSKCQVAEAVHTFESGDPAQARGMLARAKYDPTVIDPGFAAARLRTLLDLEDHDVTSAQRDQRTADALAQADATELSIVMESGILQAQVEAATGNVRAAAAKLAEIAARARRAGLPGYQSEALSALRKLPHGRVS